MDYSKLLGRMKEKKLRQTDAAEKIGVSAATMNLKLNGHTDFKQGEIRKLCEVLEIPDEEIPAYFFN